MVLIAEALATRKDLNSESRDLQSRIATAALGYEDENTEDKEDPQALIARLDQVLDLVMGLDIAINVTNNETMLQFDGEQMSVMKAIALRSRLTAESKAFHSIASSVTIQPNFYGSRSKDDVKQISRLDAKAQRKRADEAAKRVRRLDIAIQRINWSVDIIEKA